MTCKLMVRFLVVAVLIISTGCGDRLPTLEDMNDSNIRRLHSAYKIYMRAHNLTGPESKEDLQDFLQNDHTAKVLLERMGIPQETIPEIFVSERDGQPFKIRWGLSGIEDHAVVFEAEGLAGKRLVAFAKPRELGPDEYEGFWSGELKGAMPGDPGTNNAAN